MNILDLSNMGVSNSALASIDISGQLHLHEIAESLKPFGEVGVTIEDFSRGWFSLEEDNMSKFEQIYVYSGSGQWHFFNF